MYSVEEFKKLVTFIAQQTWYKEPVGFGIARLDRGQLNPDKVLQATYPVVNWKENYGSAAIFLNTLNELGVEIDASQPEQVFDVTQELLDKALESFSGFISEAKGDAHKNVQLISQLAQPQFSNDIDLDDFKLVFIFEDDKPQSVESVYLKLYALSTGKAEIRGLNLDGAFGLLHNSAWVGNEPIELDWLRANEIALKVNGQYPDITMVDKFPRLLSHVILADNTRILDASKVRFGAQLAAGTTVMPGASYINFNAGTLGAVMVEGRISSSAVVGAGSDVGGGASILGVLSGTDGEPVSVGGNTLLGANSCTGTSIGDGCIIDAGVSILPGTKVSLDEASIAALSEANPEKEFSSVMKGKDFIGINGVHFRQDSVSGKLLAKRSTREVKLNSDLH